MILFFTRIKIRFNPLSPFLSKLPRPKASQGVFQDISYVKGESKLSGEAVYVEGAAAFGLIFEKG